jgi:hypothetical protein
MKSNEQVSNKEIARRSFLLRLATATIAVIGMRSFIGALLPKKKSAADTNEKATYPVIHPMAIARKNKNE